MADLIKPPVAENVSPEVAAIRDEGDYLARRLDAMSRARGSDAFKASPALDAHLFSLQMEVMQQYLHVLTIRLARADERAKGVLPDHAPLLGKRPAIIKPN